MTFWARICKIHNAYKLHQFSIKVKIKKSALVALAIIVVLATASFLIYNYQFKDPYQFSGNTLNYAKYRGPVKYSPVLKEENISYKIYNISFESKPFINEKTIIYGLLFMPKGKNNVPALVFLPGGGGTKESRAYIGRFIAEQGYAVLIIDQRGVGQTGGTYLGLTEDYQAFAKGIEPTQFLSVFDTLKSFDVLRNIKGIDKNKIAVSGESMGGRYAMIAAAIDNRIKGVISISSSGFHTKDENKTYSPYLISIDPDHYVDKISPRYLMMIHSTNDTLITLASAEATLKLAKDPKKIYIVNNCSHGYCDKMQDDLKNALKLVFEEK